VSGQDPFPHLRRQMCLQRRIPTADGNIDALAGAKNDRPRTLALDTGSADHDVVFAELGLSHRDRERERAACTSSLERLHQAQQGARTVHIGIVSGCVSRGLRPSGDRQDIAIATD
jgi:hypothetical protein